MGKTGKVKGVLFIIIFWIFFCYFYQHFRFASMMIHLDDLLILTFFLENGILLKREREKIKILDHNFRKKRMNQMNEMVKRKSKRIQIEF